MAALAQWAMIAVFLAVFVAIPVGWYVLGIFSYGTGDYYQP